MSRRQDGQLDLFLPLPPVTDCNSTSAVAVSKKAVAPTSASKRKAALLREVAPPGTVEPQVPYLSDMAVADRYSVSRPTVWRWTKTLIGFPQPVKISSGTTRWRLADLQAFDRARHGLLVPPRHGKSPECRS